jgi:hypothetical protein
MEETNKFSFINRVMLSNVLLCEKNSKKGFFHRNENIAILSLMGYTVDTGG